MICACKRKVGNVSDKPNPLLFRRQRCHGTDARILLQRPQRHATVLQKDPAVFPVNVVPVERRFAAVVRGDGRILERSEKPAAAEKIAEARRAREQAEDQSSQGGQGTRSEQSSPDHWL